MKRSRWFVLAVVAGLIGPAGAFAQVGAAAGGAAGAGAAGGTAAGGAAGAAGAAKPGFFEKCCAKMSACRQKLCGTPAGQMLNTMTTPVTAMTGGIIPPFCPLMPTDAQQQAPGAQGAAAQGKADAANAKARVAAVEYLGTLDCHWFPEAEAGLVKALRTDRNECVRLAAAVALNRGCCCTRAILDALIDCVNGTEKFGPYENSPRVQNVALMGLEKCLNCYHDRTEPEDKKGDTGSGLEKGNGLERNPDGTPKKLDEPAPSEPKLKPAGPSAPSAIPPVVVPSEKTAQYSGRPTPEQIELGKIAVAKARAREVLQPKDQTVLGSGERDLYHLYHFVFEGGKNTPPQTTTTVSATMTAQTVPVMTQTQQPPQAAVRPMPTVRPTTTPVSTGVTATAAAPTPAASIGMNPTPTTVNGDYRPVVQPPAQPAPRQIDPKVLHCLEQLHDSPDPEVRHAAVKTLATMNWQEHPEVLPALVHAARNDKHPGMRVACIRALGTMKACTPEVMTGLKPMLGDSDEWIRVETSQALAYLQTFRAK